MTEQPFRQTPLFQLNLLVWLSMPARGEWITPIFWHNGFELYAIGPSILVPADARLRFNASSGRGRMAGSVSPDLLMRNESNQSLVTVECKVNSFGLASDTAMQALGILACTGRYVADFFGWSQSNHWSAWVTYAVSHPQQTQMSETLIVLGEQLKAVGVDQCPATAVGIDVAPDGVYLDFSALPQLPLNVSGRQKVMSLKTGEDPRPLYLLPLDPSVDAQDDYGKRVIQERLRAAFASTVASRLYLGSFVVTWEELMGEALQIWPLWKDRDSRRNLLRQTKVYVRKILDEIGRSGITTETNANGFTLAGVDRSSAQQIRRYLTGVAYRHGELDLWQEGVQLGFDDVNGWKPDSEG